MTGLWITVCVICGRVKADVRDVMWYDAPREWHLPSHGYCPECAKKEMEKVSIAAECAAAELRKAAPVDPETIEKPFTKGVAMKKIFSVEIACKEWLERNGYFGLYTDAMDEPCGCGLDDFMPCGISENLLSPNGCRPAYRRPEGGRDVYFPAKP